MANSADPDQLAKPTDLDLHCLQRQGISGFSRTRVKRICFVDFLPFLQGRMPCDLCFLSGIPVPFGKGVHSKRREFAPKESRPHFRREAEVSSPLIAYPFTLGYWHFTVHV